MLEMLQDIVQVYDAIPFLKKSFARRQHIMHNIPVATIPAASAGGFHFLSTLDIVC